MKKFEIEIPDNIWKIFAGNKAGFNLGDDIISKGLKFGFLKYIDETYEDFPEVLEWALFEKEELTSKETLKSILKTIADQL